ncbi:MAG: hypothetical protein JNL36_11800 [Candidatus Kapabacteria bacterium]|nr:hypothetical protein [Candidatus Kapabacteria bacterium]
MKDLLLKSNLVTIAFVLLFSCSEDNQNPEQMWKEHNPKKLKCGRKFDQATFLDEVGINIMSSSKDKVNFIVYIDQPINPLILTINGNSIGVKNLKIGKLNSKDTTLLGAFANPLLSPYDKNIAIGLVAFSTVIGKDNFGENVVKIFQQLCRYNLETDECSIIPLYVTKEEYEVITDNGLVHWANQSTPNDDYILIKNHKRLHLQSGKLLEGYTNKTNDANLKLVAVSPDESKFISLDPNNKNGDFYINDRKHTDKYIHHSFKNNYINKINWSDDSKTFSINQLGNDMNDFNFYTITDGNSIMKTNTLDLLTLHCSLYSNGTPFFYTDSSYIVTLYPNLSRRGELYEVNQNGEIIRQLTKIF